jgi:hypothetical protein
MNHPGTIVCEPSTWQQGDHASSAGGVPPSWEVPGADDRDGQARSPTRAVAELTKGLERASQRLQRFRERHGAQLSHPDRLWLYLAYHEVELYRAELSQLLRMQAAPPGLREALQRLQELVQRTRGLVQVARQAAQAARTTRQLLQEMRRHNQARVSARMRLHTPPSNRNGASVGRKHG